MLATLLLPVFNYTTVFNEASGVTRWQYRHRAISPRQDVCRIFGHRAGGKGI